MPLKTWLRWLRFGRLREHDSAGKRGERIAERFLKQRGYGILERNLHVGDDEADLIALDPDGRTIVLVEVKTSEGDDSCPESRIAGVKQHRLNRLAARLQRRAEYRDRPLRFDAIAVVFPPNGAEPIIRHITGAFQSKW